MHANEQRMNLPKEYEKTLYKDNVRFVENQPISLSQIIWQLICAYVGTNLKKGITEFV